MTQEAAGIVACTSAAPCGVTAASHTLVLKRGGAEGRSEEKKRSRKRRGCSWTGREAVLFSSVCVCVSDISGGTVCVCMFLSLLELISIILVVF